MNLSGYCDEQYRFLLSSRNTLFDYCALISPQDLIYSNPSFGNGGSIRNLLIHVANTYEAWVAWRILGKAPHFRELDAFYRIQDIVQHYLNVDADIKECILMMEDGNSNIDYESNGVKETTSLLQVFSHVITHEFHHKGQILSISRQMGYTPVDTDIMR